MRCVASYVLCVLCAVFAMDMFFVSCGACCLSCAACGNGSDNGYPCVSVLCTVCCSVACFVLSSCQYVCLPVFPTTPPPPPPPSLSFRPISVLHAIATTTHQCFHSEYGFCVSVPPRFSSIYYLFHSHPRPFFRVTLARSFRFPLFLLFPFPVPGTKKHLPPPPPPSRGPGDDF